MRQARTLTALMTILTLVAATGCGSETQGKPTGSAGAADNVTYITAFGAAERDAFAWIAEEKGYFREAHLNVRIELGKAGGENLKAMASGQVQFANLDLTGAMISAGAAGSKGYKDFRAILAVHQQTLVSIMSMEGTGITTPKDLAGKKIAAAANSVNQLLFPGYAKLAGIEAA